MALIGQWFNGPGIINYIYRHIRGGYEEHTPGRRWLRLYCDESIPHYYADDIRAIDTDELKKAGIKAIVSDLDGTLGREFSEEISPELMPKVRALQAALDGRFYVLSNSIGTLFFRSEAQEFQDKYNVFVLRHFLKKPWGYLGLPQMLGVNPDEIFFMGNKRSTDIVFGNNLGALTLLVDSWGEKSKDQHMKSLEEMCRLKKWRAIYHPRKANTSIVKENKMKELTSYC